MKKILTVLGIMLVILFALTIEAQAFTYNLRLQPEKTEIKPGDTVKVDVDISSISLEESEAGIISFNALLDYDSEIFSKVTVEGQENWSGVVTYSPSSKTLTGFITSLENEVMEASKIATITLTVADTAKAEDTEVTLENIKLSNGVSISVTTNDASVKFEIVEVGNGNVNDNTNKEENKNDNVNDDANKEENENDNINDDTNKDENENDNTNKDENKNNNTANKNNTTNKNNTKDNTIANKVISAAGLENISALVVGALVVIAGVSYMSYKKYKNM